MRIGLDIDNVITNLDKKVLRTSEIEEKNLVEKKLERIILTLNKKGYYTEKSSTAKMLIPFLISNMINDFIKEELIKINEYTSKKIKRILEKHDCESTIIIFKKEYNFEKLPKGYKLAGKNLFYNLESLKEDKNISFKTLNELELEFNKSIKDLESWANQLNMLE